MNLNIRLLYLYLFSFVGLIILTIGAIRLIDMGIKMAFFDEADYYEAYPPRMEGAPEPTKDEIAAYQKVQVTRNRQRELSGAVAMVIVGLPLYLYHWRKINTESKAQHDGK